jgi:hypothetical protein
VVLAILPEHGAVGIDYHRGVVIDARLLLLEDRQYRDHRQLGGECGEVPHDGPVGGFGVVVVLDVFGDAQIRRVEQLLKADHLRSPCFGLPGELLVFVEHRLLVAGPGCLGDRRPDQSHAASPLSVIHSDPSACQTAMAPCDADKSPAQCARTQAACRSNSGSPLGCR